MIRPDVPSEADRADLSFRATRYVELARILQHPAFGCSVIMALGRLDDGDKAVVHPVEDFHLAQLHRRASPGHDGGAYQIIAVAHPWVGLDPAVAWQRAVIHRLPGAQACGRPRHDAFVEGKADQRDDQRRCDQRRKYLVSGKPRRLHRYDFAILVEAGEHDERAEQDRKGQEPRDDLRRAQPDIMPQLRVAIARIGQDVIGFAQQIQRLQHDDEQRQHRESAGEEQSRHIPAELARGEKVELHQVR